MMNLRTIEKYQELEEEFYRECIRVCNEMKRYDKHFDGLNQFDLYGDEIECTSDNYFKTIPIEWLIMPDNEFKKYVDELVAEEEAKDLEIKKLYEEKQREKDLAEFNRLKEKLGL
jgi:DNA gyrase/topoisomerase IV subunit B